MGPETSRNSVLCSWIRL